MLWKKNLQFSALWKSYKTFYIPNVSFIGCVTFQIYNSGGRQHTALTPIFCGASGSLLSADELWFLNQITEKIWNTEFNMLL
jgi:hypothetical protein